MGAGNPKHGNLQFMNLWLLLPLDADENFDGDGMRDAPADKA
jgi:hypothetical protein